MKLEKKIKLKSWSARLDPEILSKLKALSIKTGHPMNELLNIALKKFFENLVVKT